MVGERRRRMAFAGVLTVIVIGAGLLGRAGVWWAVGPVQAQDEGLPLPSRGGTLFIHGGGRVSDEIRSQYLALAGGKERARIIVIPTASDHADLPDAESNYLDPWCRVGATWTKLLHTRNRATADNPLFAGLIDEANAVWISGGLQSRLVTTYVGTEVERRLRALLERGGVVGGTSAGAAVMTSLMILDGKVEAVPGEGFGFFPDVVVDQHFLRRNRMGRLNHLLAAHPDLIGIGIDESAALIVTGKRLCATGESYVVCSVPAREDRPACTVVLKPGDRTDLDSLRSSSPIISSPTALDEFLSAGGN